VNCIVVGRRWTAATRVAASERLAAGFGTVPVLEHPPYSPDLAPCDFFSFPKIKSTLKGNRFELVEAVKAKATELMNKLSEDDLQHCSNSGRFAWSSVGIGERSTLGVTTFLLCNFFNKNVLISVRLFYSHTTYTYFLYRRAMELLFSVIPCSCSSLRLSIYLQFQIILIY